MPRSQAMLALRPQALLAAVLLLAFGLRMVTLGEQSLWYDEAFSLLLARYDLSEIVARTSLDTMPPLYYWLLHLWGTGAPVDFYPRLLSAIAGTLSVALVYAVGRQLMDAGVGLWAALFTAVAPFQIFYGQETRMYALLGLWNLLAAWGFLLGWKEQRRLGWALYSLGTGLAFYTHALGGLPSLALLAWGMAVAVNAREPSRLRAPFIALVVAGICYLPWLTVLLGQARAVLSSFWASPPSVISPLASLYVFFQGPFANPTWMPLALTAVLAPLALTIYTLTRHPGPDRADLSFLWAWLALPLLALLLFSLVRSVYLERVVIGASFPVYLLLGWAAARLHPRGLGLALAAAVLCSAGAGLTLWFTDAAYGKPPLRAAAAAVNEAWQEGSPVLHTSDGSMLPFLLYAPDLPNTLLDGDPERAGRTARARSTYEALGIVPLSLEAAVGDATEFFLVVALDHSVVFQRALADRIDQRYRRVAEQDVGGITVRRYQTGAGP